MILLERRLDNIVYRSDFANTRAGARQLVAHGHMTVNGRKSIFHPILVSVGEVIGCVSEAAMARHQRTL